MRPGACAGNEILYNLPMAFKVKKGLAYRKIDGQVFIVDAAGERLHELNDVGSLVWEGLAAGKSEVRIAEAVCAEFEVTPEDAQNDTAYIQVPSATVLVNTSRGV